MMGESSRGNQKVSKSSGLALSHFLEHMNDEEKETLSFLFHSVQSNIMYPFLMQYIHLNGFPLGVVHLTVVFNPIFRMKQAWGQHKMGKESENFHVEF